MVNKLCRLCAKEKKKCIEIYKEEGLKLNLSSKIIQCLQIRIYPEDLLPKLVCVDCCIKLNQSSEFFYRCSQAQTILQMTVGDQKGEAADSFSQPQNPQDAKDFVECILLGNSNKTELSPLHSKTEKEERDEILKSKKGRRRRSQNVIKHKICDKSLYRIKGNEVQTSDSADTREAPETDIKQKDALRQRVRLEDCYTWQCTECPTVLGTLQDLKEHHHLAHAQAVRYQCIECGKVYTVYKKFTRHVRLHRNHGKYRLLSRQSLELHRKSHSGARDYTCDICGKSFAVKQGLAYHMMSHSGERPHCCKLCSKRCKTAYLLNKHVATHSDVKAHQCDVCGKQFRESSTLKLHTRIHTGAMPYRCEFCGRQFRFQGVYVIHRRQHTGERPYSCSECKRDFTNWANYNKHIKCRHRGKSRTMLAPDKIQCSTSYDCNPVNNKQIINVSQESDANVTLISCTGSGPTDYSSKNTIRPQVQSQNRADCEVTFHEPVSFLCPLQESSKSGMSTAMESNQYLSSQLYSHVHAPAPSLYGFLSSNVNNEYTNIGELSG